MDATDRAILTELAARIRGEVDARARIWAYGSRARGDGAPDADFDVCVVVPHVDPQVSKAVRRVAWEIAFEQGRVIPVIVLPEEEFERGPMSASTLVANILR